MIGLKMIHLFLGVVTGLVHSLGEVWCNFFSSQSEEESEIEPFLGPSI